MYGLPVNLTIPTYAIARPHGQSSDLFFESLVKEQTEGQDDCISQVKLGSTERERPYCSLKFHDVSDPSVPVLIAGRCRLVIIHLMWISVNLDELWYY